MGDMVAMIPHLPGLENCSITAVADAIKQFEPAFNLYCKDLAAPDKNHSLEITIVAPQEMIAGEQYKTMYENIIIGLLIKRKIWKAKRRISDIFISWKINYTSNSGNGITIRVIEQPGLEEQ